MKQESPKETFIRRLGRFACSYPRHQRQHLWEHIEEYYEDYKIRELLENWVQAHAEYETEAMSEFCDRAASKDRFVHCDTEQLRSNRQVCREALFYALGLDEVHEPLPSIEEIREKLRPIFKGYPVYKAILFGSYAKGEADHRSDVDIVINSHRELLDIRFFGLIEDIRETLDKRVDLIEWSSIREGSQLLEEIEAHGVVLFQKQEDNAKNSD